MEYDLEYLISNVPDFKRNFEGGPFTLDRPIPEDLHLIEWRSTHRIAPPHSRFVTFDSSLCFIGYYITNDGSTFAFHHLPIDANTIASSADSSIEHGYFTCGNTMYYDKHKILKPQLDLMCDTGFTFIEPPQNGLAALDIKVEYPNPQLNQVVTQVKVEFGVTSAGIMKTFGHAQYQTISSY